MPPLDPILIVDDERDNLEALQRLLRNQFAISITTSPFEALKLIQQKDFHVIVSDQRMPEMTGVELLEKAKHVRPEAIRILLTGYTDIDSVIGAINRGNIYRYLAKPWDPEDLKLTLRQANEAYGLRRELDRKNAELTASNAELKQALVALETLDRAKARFLSLVSHELNTPLTVLTSFVALLADRKEAFPEDIRKAVSSLSAASGRFSEIVGEVLTYVKLESDPRFHPRPCDLAEELATVKGAMKDVLAKRKLSLTITATGGAVASCDPEKTRVALRRLLEDAALRSPEGETVAVTLSTREGNVLVTVARKGEPVSPDAFVPFETAADPLRHHKNLGLSLAICKLVAEGHGGELSLDASDAKGTAITLRLPSAG